MSNHELEVVLKMRDEASKKIEQFSQKVENEMGKAGDSLVKFGQQFGKISRDMTMIGGAITAPLALAFKTYSDYSVEASEALKQLENSSKEFQITIGSALTPIVEKVSNIISGLVQWFQSLDPKVRDTALQFSLMAGIGITLVGVLGVVISKVSDLTGRLLQIAKANIPLLATVAIVATMIIYWDKLRGIIMPVLNVIEAGLSGVAWVFQTVLGFLAEGMVFIETKVAKLLDVLAMIPGPQQAIFRGLADTTRAAAAEFETFAGAARTTADELANNMTKIGEGNNGALTSFVDEGITNFNKLLDAIKNFSPQANAAMQDFSLNFASTFKQAYDGAVNIGKNSADILVTQVKMFSSKFGEGFANMLVKGEDFGAAMKQMFIDMATTFIAAVAEMIVQWMAFMALKAAASFFGLGFFHQGGMIMHQGGTVMHSGGPVYAHSGLAVDEVPIIAQRGEGILSRQGMRNLGGPLALNSLNRGGSAGTGTVNNYSFSIDFSNSQIMSDDLPEKIKHNLAEYISRVIARGSYC